MADRVYLYQYSRKEAKRCNEEKLWLESHQENCRCARAIEEAIRQNFDGKTLDSDCAKGVLDEFGYHRVMWVLATALKEKSGDGRFSNENREWLRQFYIPNEKARREYVPSSHSAVLDGFINQTHRAWNDLNLFDVTHCHSEKDGELDYTDKVLVIHPFSLKDEYKTPEDQLFLAQSGFGCSPNSLGRKVFGMFLKDSEKARYYRTDFIGVIKDEHLPEWAREKVQEILHPEESEDMTMGGISQ